MAFVLSEFIIEKKNPLKQGLKLESAKHFSPAMAIEKKNPLKQGLKLPSYFTIHRIIFIEKKNPLKQGLKPSPVLGAYNYCGLKRRIH